MRRLALILVGCAVSVAGCGGGSSQPPARASDKLQVPAYSWRTDFSNHILPLGEFASGGPRKDGIPALDHPMFIPAAKTTFLQPEEPVIELAIGRRARAYPIEILIWHEIATTTLRGRRSS